MRKYLVCIFLIVSTCLFAADSWDGQTYSKPQLSSSQYTISSASELAWLSRESQTNDFAGYSFLLTVDIDLCSHPWTPIGNFNTPFSGVFDGNAKSIKNINITASAADNIGLFGVIGTAGEVRNLAIGQGIIFERNKRGVGGLAGINYGEISECFSLLQIVAHQSTCIGGLVGVNAATGKIINCYNAAVISDGLDTIGGVIGLNDGTLTNSYNIGYCVNGGAIVGVNRRVGGFTNVYYDQKMCRKDAGVGSLDGINVVELTADMFSLFALNDVWTTSEDIYPQLKRFAGTPISLVSVSPLTFLDNRIERAELLTLNFWLSSANGVSWHSPADDVIRLRSATAVVNRPCQTQIVMLEARLGGFVKNVYTAVKGFDVFSPGMMARDIHVCLYHPLSITACMSLAAGGKDDDLEHYPYTYRIECSQLTTDVATQITDTTFLFSDVVVGNEKMSKYLCPASKAGLYMYIVYAHDSKCQTEFVKAADTCFYRVFSEVRAGAIDNTVDTIYGGMPIDTTINELSFATGGDGNYHYRWFVTEESVNYVTGKREVILNDEEVKVNRHSADTVTLRATLEAAHEYTFVREVRDSYCMRNDEYLTSQNTKRFVVYDSLYAGALAGRHILSCEPQIDDVLSADSIESGGNGRYMYRWFVNGRLIDGANEAVLRLNTLSLDYHNTYFFRRQVKDDTGLMDWQSTEREDTVVVLRKFSAGSIADSEHNYCLDPACMCGLPGMKLTNYVLPSGDGPFSYSQVLSYVSGKDTLLLDTFRLNTPSSSVEWQPADYPKVPIPATFILRRVVSDTLCHSAGVSSAGQVVWHVGVEEKHSEVVELCREQLPYKFNYTNYAGETQTIELQKDSQIVNISDLTKEGCRKDVSYICSVRYPPQVEVAESAMLCQSETTFSIYYKVISGTPTHCSVEYSDDGKLAGLRDTVVALDNSGVLSLENNALATGTFAVTLRFYDADELNPCRPDEHQLECTFALAGFVHRKWTDVLYADNNDKNGYPNAYQDRKFVAWQWYKDGEMLEGQNGQFYVEQGGLNGVYYVILTDDEGRTYRSCDYEARPLTDAAHLLADDMFNVYPTAVTAGGQLQVFVSHNCLLEWYMADGRLLLSTECNAGHQSFTVPSVQGVVLLYFKSKNNITAKKIVIK